MAKLYRVLIEENSISSIYVNAESPAEANVIALDLYIDGKRNWLKGNTDIIETKEVIEYDT